jgi:hypothetical protein
MMYLKLLEKQEQTKPKGRRLREIIKIRAKRGEETRGGGEEIDEIKTKKNPKN